MRGDFPLVAPGFTHGRDVYEGEFAGAMRCCRYARGRDRMAVDARAAKCKKAAQPTGRGEESGPMGFWDSDIGILLIILAQCLLVLVVILVSLAFLLYADRKIWAAVQIRRGPNVVGPWGLLQSFADFLKFLLKEVVIPAGADKPVFLLAPLMSFTFAAIAWAAIPFADGWVISDLNVGILYLFAVSSLGVYGVIMGGWASKIGRAHV